MSERSSLMGDIECPIFAIVVQTLLLRSNIGTDEIARGMALACSVPPDVAIVRLPEKAQQFVGWVAAGLGDQRKPDWWQD